MPIYYVLIDIYTGMPDALIVVTGTTKEELQAGIDEAGELWYEEDEGFKIDYVKRYLKAHFKDVQFIDYNNVQKVEY